MRDGTAKFLSSVHTGLYRFTAGRIGRRLVDNDMLLLTTVGRRTGKRHTIPLLYLRHGDDHVVIASWGGRDDPPDWYHNLLATPDVEIQVEGRRIPVRAVRAEPALRAELWERAVAAYDGYAVYQSRTERQIPIFLLVSRMP